MADKSVGALARRWTTVQYVGRYQHRNGAASRDGQRAWRHPGKCLAKAAVALAHSPHSHASSGEAWGLGGLIGLAGRGGNRKQLRCGKIIDSRRVRELERRRASEQEPPRTSWGLH